MTPLFSHKIVNSLKALAFIAIGLLIYSNTFQVPFQFDDKAFIENNLAIRDITNISAIWHYLSHPSRFIAFYSFALNYHFHGLDVAGYHVLNLAVHILNAILVYWLSLLLFSTPKTAHLAIAAHKEPISFFTALLFLAHPLQTQAVTYLSQRFASLAALFYLIALCCYLKARLIPFEQKSRVAWAYFSLSIISGILGMFTKQIVFTLPFIILLSEWMFFRDAKPHRVLRLWWMAFGLSIFLILAFFLRETVQAPFKTMASYSHAGEMINGYTYFLTQWRVIPYYIFLLFFPMHQNLDYDFSISKSLFDPFTTFAGAVCLILIIWTAFRLRARQPLIAFGIFWFFMTLSVESSIIPIRHVIFEHRAYLPSVGFFLVASQSIFLLTRNLKSSIAILSILTILFSVLTFARNKVWQTEFTLWQDVAGKSPQKSRPHIYLGLAYLEQNNLEKAFVHLSAAVHLDPNLAEGYNDRGIVYKRMGKYAEALDDFAKAMALNPNYVDAFYNRGNTYSLLKRHDEAIADFTKVLTMDSHYDAAYYNRGNAYNRKGAYDAAISDYTYFINRHPDMGQAFYGRGIAYLRLGETQKARQDFEKAKVLGQNNLIQ